MVSYLENLLYSVQIKEKLECSGIMYEIKKACDSLRF
jgi:hypothetical protein